MTERFRTIAADGVHLVLDLEVGHIRAFEIGDGPNVVRPLHTAPWVDDAAMRFTEFFQTIPSFALAIVIVAILQPALSSIIIAIGIVSWPPVARLVRGEVLSLRTRDYVQAAITLGQSPTRIIATQVLPNAIAPTAWMPPRQ